MLILRHASCLLSKVVKGLSKKQLLKENQELREENARLRQEIELLRQKMDLLIRRVFGRSSEKLDASQLDLFLMSQESEPGKVDASSLEEADPRHEPRGRGDARCRERWPADLPVVEEIIDPKEVQKAPQDWRLIGAEVSEQLDYEPGRFLRRRLVRRKIRAAWGPGSTSRDRCLAAEPAGALHRVARTSGADHRKQVLRSSSALQAGGHFWKPPRGSSAAAEHGPLDGAGR